ncbi:hypothetical protein PM082_014059 [Marasmius tenuissimus]|nr:hypothetical protein PM082_014059 [Marasmius tenuissimus]
MRKHSPPSREQTRNERRPHESEFGTCPERCKGRYNWTTILGLNELDTCSDTELWDAIAIDVTEVSRNVLAFDSDGCQMGKSAQDP